MLLKYFCPERLKLHEFKILTIYNNTFINYGTAVIAVSCPWLCAYAYEITFAFV